jgi:hypothetical protein
VSTHSADADDDKADADMTRVLLYPSQLACHPGYSDAIQSAAKSLPERPKPSFMLKKSVCPLIGRRRRCGLRLDSVRAAIPIGH